MTDKQAMEWIWDNGMLTNALNKAKYNFATLEGVKTYAKRNPWSIKEKAGNSGK